MQVLDCMSATPLAPQEGMAFARKRFYKKDRILFLRRALSVGGRSVGHAALFDSFSTLVRHQCDPEFDSSQQKRRPKRPPAKVFKVASFRLGVRLPVELECSAPLGPPGSARHDLWTTTPLPPKRPIEGQEQQVGLDSKL